VSRLLRVSAVSGGLRKHLSYVRQRQGQNIGNTIQITREVTLKKLETIRATYAIIVEEIKKVGFFCVSGIVSTCLQTIKASSSWVTSEPIPISAIRTP